MRRREDHSVAWRKCRPTGKRRYGSEGDALIGALTLQADYVRAYECEKCGGWHVTTKRLYRSERALSLRSRQSSRKEVMVKSTKDEAAPVLDPTRSEQRAALDALDDDLKVTKGYAVLRYTGERVYFSDDKADAEARLKEVAAESGGIGPAPDGEPAYTLVEVSYVEVATFDPNGPESRTRGKKTGEPAQPDQG